jgi:hypothetical protein
MAESATTREFPLEFLKRITDDFSEKHIIGSGGYGVVYKVYMCSRNQIYIL